MMGHSYYPCGGTEDWKGTFKTYEEAKSQFQEIVKHKLFTKGKRIGQIKDTNYSYVYNGITYDWYKIVDLTEWCN